MNKNNERRKIFGENLERIINKSVYSRKEIADAIKVSETSISYYCRGITVPTFDKIFEIADFLKVSINELLGETVILVGDNVFEWRFRRALKLCATAGYFVDPTEDDTVDITLPDKSENNPPELVARGYLLITGFRNDYIKIRSREDFVKVVEYVEERAVRENSSFDTNFKWFMRDFYECERQAKIDAFEKKQKEKIRKSEEEIRKAGFEPVSEVTDTNENEFSDVVKES